ncbi:MAG: N-acetylmuramidase domain-containing protein [Pseudomonadota bacterium]
MAFYKDDPVLKAAALAPAHPITQLPPAGTTLGAIARTHNAVGGLIEKAAAAIGVEPMAVLAVWHVESGTLPYIPGKPVLRFENHKFWSGWGENHAAVFDRHFRFGGHGATGASWKNHTFRNPVTGPWRSFHGTQTKEYEVFNFASTLATKEAACLACSFGGPQIMGFNHDKCGYRDACSLFDAFGADLRWQVLGFFDFVTTTDCVRHIRTRQWERFGACYNGNGPVYGPLIAAAFALKAQFLALPR